MFYTSIAKIRSFKQVIFYTTQLAQFVTVIVKVAECQSSNHSEKKLDNRNKTCKKETKTKFTKYFIYEHCLHLILI